MMATMYVDEKFAQEYLGRTNWQARNMARSASSFLGDQAALRLAEQAGHSEDPDQFMADRLAETIAEYDRLMAEVKRLRRKKIFLGLEYHPIVLDEGRIWLAKAVISGDYSSLTFKYI